MYNELKDTDVYADNSDLIDLAMNTGKLLKILHVTIFNILYTMLGTCTLKLKIDHIFQDLLFFSKIGDRIWAGVFIFFQIFARFWANLGSKKSPCFSVFPLHNGI